MPYVCSPDQRDMTVVTLQHLTGRSRTHVVQLPELACSLHPQAARALLAMRRAAARSGLGLAVASAFRDFDQQLLIWNGKFRGERAVLDRDGAPLQVAQMQEEPIVRAILHWSALPGASRHHWGTEVDVFDRTALPGSARPRLTPDEYADDGRFAALSSWLARHGGHYGFFRPYDIDRGGVQPEPWHLSYAPLAHALQPQLTVATLADALAGVPLAGAATVRRLLPEIHARYVRAVAEPDTLALAAAGVDAVGDAG
jgi:LAS superfamily LD-carboxypeptidase LdcB